MNYTPGPWRLETIRDIVFHSPEWAECPDDQAEADARLIAAAPDLLTALESLVSACENEGFPHLGNILPAARRAITKATGA